MKPAEKIEKLIKNTDIDTNANMDKAVLDDVLKAFETSKNKKSAKPKPDIWRAIMKRPITKLATAAVIIMAVGFFVIHRDSNEKIDNHRALDISRLPVEMMTVASLNIAYRRGGMDAVEEQCDKVCEMLGTQPASISLEELMAGFNGT